MYSALIVFICTLSISLSAQNIAGKWKTIDDETGEEKSIVEIFEKGGKYYGKIVRLFPREGEDPDPVCDQCDESDPRFKKKIIGMEIMKHLDQDGQEYAGGEILDPQNGRVYRCRVWLSAGDLKVRGYWGPFYRTQTWKRAH